MSEFDPLIAQAEQKYGLPPGILAATAQVESSGNPNAVSPQGAVGLMQLLPTTAKALGADPRDPAQAIDAAGRLWAQNLKASGGDIDRAAMMYHGGTDTRQWGPKTQAYPAKLAAALGPVQSQPEGGDPIEAALSGQAPQSQPAPAAHIDPNDPIEAALAGGTRASNASVPNGPVVHGAGGNNPQAGPPGNGVPDNGAGRNILGAQAGTGPGTQGGATGGLQQDHVGYVPGAIDAGLSGYTAGLVHPVTAALNTIIPLDKLTNPNVKSIWDSSLPDAYHNNLQIERGNFADFRDTHPKTSWAADIGGAIASPFNKMLAPAEGAGLLGSIPSLMLQGAAYGGTRGASDTGTVEGTATGAGVGEALGPVAGAVGTVAGKVLGAVLRGRSTLANAIPQSLKKQVAGMIDSGASVQQIIDALPEAKDIAHIPQWVDYRAQGGKAPVAFEAPPEMAAPEAPAGVPTPAPEPDAKPIVITGSRTQKLAAALGTQGSRRGVESVTDLPAPVQADVQRLTNAGVSPEEAQREADVLYVGGKPTVAAVTRDPAEQWAFNEGAKDTSTPNGQALNDTQAGNNQALHDTINETVENYGGVPAQGEPAQVAAEALAKASDASRANVNGLYAKARATDGDVKINTDELRELLQSPQMATPTNPQVQQLANGVRTFLQSSDQRAGTTLRTPEEIEQIRQLANSAYDPMGGSVNNAVGKIGAALNDSLDQLDQASTAWRAARAAHRQWATQYADPDGVASLIARDANGNFLNADRWRLSENGLVNRLDDKPFAQVAGQLKAIGAGNALDRIKAGIVQSAYERATNSARDKLGNPVVNGKLFQQELNKIGTPKLQALFSPDEIAHLATVGRAARAVNEAVPGTVNTSNTSAAVKRTQTSLAAALQVKPGSHPVLTGAKYLSALGGHAPVAVAIHVGEHLTNNAAKNAISQGIREQLNPGLARAVAARSTSKIENAQFRSAMGRALRSRSAVPAADNDRGRALGRSLRGAL